MDGSKEKITVAYLEVGDITRLEGGRTAEHVAQLQLGRGGGPIHRTTWRVKSGARKQNWSENITPVVKEKGEAERR